MGEFGFELLLWAVTAGLGGTVVTILHIWRKQAVMEDQIGRILKAAEADRKAITEFRQGAADLLRAIEVHVTEDREMHKRTDEQVHEINANLKRSFNNHREHYQSQERIRERISTLEGKVGA